MSLTGAAQFELNAPLAGPISYSHERVYRDGNRLTVAAPGADRCGIDRPETMPLAACLHADEGLFDHRQMNHGKNRFAVQKARQKNSRLSQ